MAAAAAQPLHKVNAVQPWHVYVGDDHVHGVALQEFQSAEAVFGLQHFESGGRQGGEQDLSHPAGVVDRQHDLAHVGIPGAGDRRTGLAHVCPVSALL